MYVGTRNHYDFMYWSLKSLLKNSDVDEVYLMIEDDEFPHPIPPCVTPINVSGQTIFPKGGPNYGCQWTYMTLLRAAAALLFPTLDRILTLDNDTIVVDDISDLWELPIKYDGQKSDHRSTKDAKVMFTQWGGKRRLYVGFDGCCIITKDGEDWKFKTGIPKFEFDEKTDKIIEVIKNAGL